MSVSQLEALVGRLEKVADRLDGQGSGGAAPAGGGAGGAAAGGDDARYVTEFDNLISEHVDAYVKAAGSLSANVQKQAAAVKDAFLAQRAFLKAASLSKKPSDAEFGKALGPLGEQIDKVKKLEDNRAPEKNHLSMASNGMDCLTWVTISPAPGPYIGEMLGAAQSFGNKVIMEKRGTPEGEPHVNYCKSFYAIIAALTAYVKAHHTTGVAWNPKGGELSAAMAGGAAKPAAKAGGPPPPPKYDAARMAELGEKKKPAAAGGGGGGMSNMLAELNKGEAVTSGLKKVTDDMKSKNQPGRSGVVSEKPKAAPAKKFGAAAVSAGPPKFQLEGKKWVVENQVDNTDLSIGTPEPNQVVYIYKCLGKAQRSLVTIGGKVNSVCVDQCDKTSVIIGDVVAAVELINSKKVEVQLNGSVPTMSLDNVNGCTIYMTNEQALNTHIFTSKCSEINVVLPVKGDDDPVEAAVPEQYETVVVDGKLVTTPVSHVGV
mmetsp:Transcript_13582/g.31299  ORF Transcript_13582/g.31299 Transcript_13582/m.31299 type:complete len:487 (+) Transcript_13582:34-1494(+)